MAISNTTQTISWNGSDMTIMEAIELAKQMRSDIGQLTHLGSRKKLERQSGRGSGDGAVTLFNVALYDPEAYQAQARKKEREVTRLSSLIEHANHTSMITFDASKYMGSGSRRLQACRPPRVRVWSRRLPSAGGKVRATAYCLSDTNKPN